MSCGQLALQRLGIEVDTYYASEIDKYAMQVTQANFPNTIHIGDVCNIKAEDYPNIDLILAGSPCQGFSFAGKQLAFDDPRSALFFEFVRLLKEIKPKYFLLENVKMKQQFQDVITEQVSACYPDFEGGDLFGSQIKPILINSALLSAQNRQRLYWTNIPNIEQPEDKGIVLRDILEDQISKEFYYKEKSIAYMERGSDKWAQAKSGRRADGYEQTSDKEKSFTITANWHKGVPYNYFKETKPNQINPSKKAGGKQPYMQDRVFHKEGKSHALTESFASRTHVGELIEEERIIVNKEKKQLLIAEATKKGYTVIEDGDCFDINFPNSKTKRGRNMKYKCNALTTASQNFMRFENLSWRKLTPLECMRLQTVPDDYLMPVSNSQKYKLLGNGMTVDVIAHILNNMKL